jgi:hypothetical protein
VFILAQASRTRGCGKPMETAPALAVEASPWLKPKVKRKRDDERKEEEGKTKQGGIMVQQLHGGCLTFVDASEDEEEKAQKDGKKEEEGQKEEGKQEEEGEKDEGKQEEKRCRRPSKEERNHNRRLAAIAASPKSWTQAEVVRLAADLKFSDENFGSEGEEDDEEEEQDEEDEEEEGKDSQLDPESPPTSGGNCSSIDEGPKEPLISELQSITETSRRVVHFTLLRRPRWQAGRLRPVGEA